MPEISSKHVIDRSIDVWCREDNTPVSIDINIEWLNSHLAPMGLTIVAKSDAEFLKVFDSVPENLVQAWSAPHAFVGWYNDLGTAFKAWRKARSE